MQPTKSLIEIGTEIPIDVSLIQDRIPNTLLKVICEHPKGQFLGYKLVDGGELGLILRLNDGSVNWFFQSELKKNFLENFLEETNSNSDSIYSKKQIHKVQHSNSIKSLKNNEPEIKVSIIYLLSPINFIRWLIFALSDVT